MLKTKLFSNQRRDGKISPGFRNIRVLRQSQHFTPKYELYICMKSREPDPVNSSSRSLASTQCNLFAYFMLLSSEQMRKKKPRRKKKRKLEKKKSRIKPHKSKMKGIIYLLGTDPQEAAETSFLGHQVSITI